VVLVLAESALETVPAGIGGHAACRSAAKKAGKKPTRMILDGSIHHSAMRTLQDGRRRGRPDIIHFCLLEALGSPLNREGLLDTWVHTYDDLVLHFDPSVKLPRNQDRFKGVLEKLFADGKLDNGLITLEKGVSFPALTERLGATSLIGLVEDGPETLGDVIAGIAGDVERDGENSGEPGDSVTAVVVGGFAHGDFSPQVARTFTHRAAVYRESLDTWTTVARVMAAWERVLGI
jgi:rRNA small subunit pseudouridine methyltransferase Nep1